MLTEWSCDGSKCLEIQTNAYDDFVRESYAE